MGEAIISGLLASKQTRASHLTVAEPRSSRRQELKRRYKINCVAKNQELLQKSDVVVLAVKPQAMAAVLDEIKSTLSSKHLIISIAAGIDTRTIKKRLGTKVRLIRTMPNTPALLGQGITGLFAAPSATAADIKVARQLFDSVGTTLLFKKEAQLDWVTAVSGSGPAYVFLFLETLVAAGVAGGLSRQQARELALATVGGATELAKHSRSPFKTLREQVTSKGGTTAAALKVLKEQKWAPGLKKAIAAAAKRAQELRG